MYIRRAIHVVFKLVCDVRSMAMIKLDFNESNKYRRIIILLVFE